MSFLKRYVDQLRANASLPKFQNERAISTLLQLYLEEIVKRVSGKKFSFITPELPLEIARTNQSTNIDYFLLSEDKKTGLVIELKTETQGNDHHFVKQIKDYRIFSSPNEARDRIQSVISNVGKNRKPSHKIKYDYLQTLIGNSLNKIEQWEIMYIAPDYFLASQLKNNRDAREMVKYHVGFGQLIEYDFDPEWIEIKRYLAFLNDEVKDRCLTTQST